LVRNSVENGGAVSALRSFLLGSGEEEEAAATSPTANSTGAARTEITRRNSENTPQKTRDFTPGHILLFDKGLVQICETTAAA
jgi:hypothetical protein